jgi:hypothetical protein
MTSPSPTQATAVAAVPARRATAAQSRQGLAAGSARSLRAHSSNAAHRRRARRALAPRRIQLPGDRASDTGTGFASFWSSRTGRREARRQLTSVADDGDPLSLLEELARAHASRLRERSSSARQAAFAQSRLGRDGARIDEFSGAAAGSSAAAARQPTAASAALARILRQWGRDERKTPSAIFERLEGRTSRLLRAPEADLWRRGGILDPRDARRPPPNVDFADSVEDLVKGDPLGLGTLAVAAEATQTPPHTPTRAVPPRTEARAPKAVVVSPRDADRRGHDEGGAFTRLWRKDNPLGLDRSAWRVVVARDGTWSLEPRTEAAAATVRPRPRADSGAVILEPPPPPRRPVPIVVDGVYINVRGAFRVSKKAHAHFHAGRRVRPPARRVHDHGRARPAAGLRLGRDAPVRGAPAGARR